MFKGNADMRAVAQRLYDYYLSAETSGQAGKYREMLLADGSFPDVDYADENNANWKPTSHLSRLRDMTVEYRRTGDVALREAVLLGLRYWYARKPVSRNWWHNQIGQQLQVGPTALMLADELPDDLLSNCVKLLFSPSEVNARVATGQNLVWFAQETLHRGLISGNEGDVKAGIDYIINEIRISDVEMATQKNASSFNATEGIQPDFSFHQHGPQLYNGGYGLGFMNDTVFYAYMVRGTQYAYPAEKLNMLAGLLLEGDRWMVYGKYMDYGVTGREIARPGSFNKALSLLPACKMLKELVPDRRSEMESLEGMINGECRQCVTGNRYFYRSDYMSHREDSFVSTVRMTSGRMFGTESMNGENLKGCWLPFGVHTTLVNGGEYAGIIPLLNWTRLPGTTAPQVLYTMPVFVTSQSEFAGGVSDGKAGVAAMTFDKLDTSAKKAWFFLGGEVCCLGTDIASTSDFPVFTTLNQCILKTDVIADGENLGREVSAKLKAGRVYHDGIVYMPLDGAEVLIEAKHAVADWDGIGNAQSAPNESKKALRLDVSPTDADILTICISHGVRPNSATYAYSIIPSVSLEKQTEVSSAYAVLINSAECQAVKHSSGALGCVFHQAGEYLLEGLGTLSVSAPCIAMFKPQGNGVAAFISSPLADVSSVDLALTRAGQSLSANVQLPSGVSAGDTVRVEL